jgi:hypothetical protein
MNQFLHDHKRHRRGLTFAALAALLSLSAVGLTQCKMVDNNVTGVEIQQDNSFHGRNACRDRCWREYKKARLAEERRHWDALCKCARLKGKAEKDCKSVEQKKHQDIVMKLRAIRKACKNKCYNEGGGHGGRG